MLSIKREKEGDVVCVRLAGSLVVDGVEFLGGDRPHEVRVNCKELLRINSTGIRAWIKNFEKLQAQGTRVVFQECSTAVVEKMNMFSAFVCGKVESIYLPFYCRSCKEELVGLYRTRELVRRSLRVSSLPCPKCGGTAVFDDKAETYLGFLRRDQSITV